MKKRLSFLAILGFAPLAVLAWGSSSSGKYVEEIRNPLRGTNYTLVRTLNLNKDGKADLYTEYKGDKPTVDRATVAELGSLMDLVRQHRKIKHEGSWSLQRSHVIVQLNRVEAGGDRRNVASSFDFEVTGNDLIANRQDTGDYGSRTIQMHAVDRLELPRLPNVPITHPGASSKTRTATDLDLTSAGGGYLSRQKSPASSFDRARLILRKDGTFELRAQGKGETLFRGTYDLHEPTEALLEVSEAFGGRAQGGGQANLGHDNQLSKIGLRGEVGGRRFTLTFDAR